MCYTQWPSAIRVCEVHLALTPQTKNWENRQVQNPKDRQADFADVLAPWPSLSRSPFIWKVCWLVRLFSVCLRSLHKIDPLNIKCYSLQVVLTNKEIHWRCEKNTPLVGHSRTNVINCGHHGYTRSTNRWLWADIKRVSHLAWGVENEVLSR